MPRQNCVNASLTANGIQVANTTATGINSTVLTNGQLLIGSTGAAPVAAAPVAGSGITITPAAGTFTVSASPTVISANIVVYAANATYTPPANLLYAIVECVGGGAAGGGAATTTGISVGAGGSGGSYTRSVFAYASLTPNVAITIGSGGTGVSGANGNAGGSTTFGALVTAPGGSGGGLATSTTGATGVNGASPGSAPTGTVVFSSRGQSGETAFGIGTGTLWGQSGRGGQSLIGPSSGGAVFTNGTGTATGGNGVDPGSGGGGSVVQNSTAVVGGDGVAGYVVITELLS